MIQAAVRGGFSFKGAELRDPHWWRKLNLHLDQLEGDNYNYVSHLRALQHLAVVDYALPPEAFEKHWDASNNFIGDIYKRLCPWEQHKQPNKVAEDLWTKEFGKPGDPDVEKRIDETVAQLKGMAEAAFKTEEYRILRRKPGISRRPRR